MSDVTIGASLRSILVQVAFKAAVDLKSAGVDNGVSLTDATEALYGLLVEAHQAHDAGDDPNDIRYSRRGGGGGGKRSGGGGGYASTAKVPNEAKSTIELDYYENGTSVSFYDNRPFKQGAANPDSKYAGAYSERSADFQSVDAIDDGKRKSLWLTTPNGDPNDDVRALVRRAESASASTRPF